MSKKHQARRVVEAFYATDWALAPEKLEQIAELVELRSSGETFTDEEVRIRIAGSRERDDYGDEPYTVDGNGVAVLPVYGVMAPKMNLMMDISGGVSSQQLAAAVRQAAADPAVRALVLDVDSPGGSAYGVAEAAAAVRKARLQKPVVAVANYEAASGAYWFASQATEIVAAPSSKLGSIGVYGLHRDTSKAEEARGLKTTVIRAGKNKAVGNPYEPLTAERKAVLQESVDDYYRLFVDEVARGRGVSSEIVEKQFGQGKSMVADRAVRAGLADRIGTLEEVIAELGKKTSSRRDPQTGPRAQESNTMDPKLMEVLRKRGLIDGESTKGEATAALCAWYAAKGKEIPKVGDDFDVAKIAAELSGPPKPERPDPVEPPKAAEPLAAPPKVADSPAPKAADPDPSAIARAQVEERVRIREIEARGELLGISAEEITAAIDAGTPVEKFLLKHTAQAAGKEGPLPKIETGKAASDKFAAAAVDSLCMRGGLKIEQPTDGCRELGYASMLDLAKESFRVCTGRAVIGSPDQMARAALGDPQARAEMGIFAGPLQGPGDFPNILSAAASKILEAAPDYVGTTYQRWAYKKPAVPDFKPSTLVRFGEFGEMPLHVDGDGFEQSTLSEDYAWIQVDSYGDEFGLTPKMVVDDDLGAFTDALADKQNAHDQTLNRLCVNLLTGNVAAADGVALFHTASHGNDIAAGSGAAPDTDELSAMRLLLRKQTGVGGRRKLGYTLDLLLIPEDLETTTQKLLLATLNITPATTATTEPFRGRVDFTVEPMLADNSTTTYYGFANPQRARSIVYCHQRGFETMQKRDYYDPKTNCRQFQFEGRFAAAINNHRGVCRNAGA